jgi:phospholipid/cholesterol/gamma-HCH transport system substrate-binding protein
MKFSLIEKKALIGVLVVMTIFIISILVIGRKNLWFESKNYYVTELGSAEGLSVGSLVTLSGLRVGEISSLQVNQDNRVTIGFTIRRSLANKIRQKTLAKVMRSFVIGEKKINIIPGPIDSSLTPDGGRVTGEDSTELTDMLSGDNIALLMKRVEGVTSGLDRWSNGLSKLLAQIKPDEVTSIYRQIRPTMKNINLVAKDGRYLIGDMRQQLFKDRLAGKVMQNFEQVLTPLARRKELMEQVLDNLQVISDELRANPQFTGEMINTLKEVVITLKAIQKTWVLKDHVKR